MHFLKKSSEKFKKNAFWYEKKHFFFDTISNMRREDIASPESYILKKENKMKKILGVSLIAMLAVSPMMAMADTTPTHDDNGPVATAAPKYATVSATASSNIASTSYVKGAYNAAIKAVNKTYADLSSAISDVSSAKMDKLYTEGDPATEISSTVLNTVRDVESASSANLVTEMAVAGAIGGVNTTISNLGNTYATKDLSNVSANAVTSTLAASIIADKAISGSKLADDTVSSAQIATSAVGTAEIADGAITVTDINSTAMAATITDSSSNKLATESAVYAATKDAATKAGVVATVGAAKVSGDISGTVTVHTNWDDDSSTLTADVSASIDSTTTTVTVTSYVSGS